MSTRRFNHLFQREIGVNPKAFVRIRRSQSALSRLQRLRGKDPGLSLLAVETGYADQSHVIRDFKILSGFTLIQYRSLTFDRLRHVPHPEHDQMCPAPAPQGIA